MRAAQIRELKQEFYNPDGIGLGRGLLPNQSLATAQAGYKEGEITLEGRDHEGQIRKVVTGEEPIEGMIPQALPDLDSQIDEEGFVSGIVRAVSRLGAILPRRVTEESENENTIAEEEQ